MPLLNVSLIVLATTPTIVCWIYYWTYRIIPSATKMIIIIATITTIPSRPYATARIVTVPFTLRALTAKRKDRWKLGSHEWLTMMTIPITRSALITYWFCYQNYQSVMITITSTVGLAAPRVYWFYHKPVSLFKKNVAMLKRVSIS